MLEYTFCGLVICNKRNNPHIAPALCTLERVDFKDTMDQASPCGTCSADAFCLLYPDTLIIPVFSSLFTSMGAAIDAIIIHEAFIGGWNMACEQCHEFHNGVSSMLAGRGPVLSLIYSDSVVRRIKFHSIN